MKKHKFQFLSKFFAMVKNNGSPWPIWTIPIILVVVAILAFGLLARQQGFHWDDWYFAWTRLFRGQEGLQELFSVTRPMRADVDSFFTYILGVNPFAWQIFSMAMRLLATFSLWWFLWQVWPKHPRSMAVVALLFLIYPGFSQQSLAMTYYYFWIFEALFFLSMGMMVFAIRRRRWLWPLLIFASVLATVQLFAMEYLFGLEILRPLFIWFILTESVPVLKKRFQYTVLYEIPFIVGLVIFLCWRFFIFNTAGYQAQLILKLGKHFWQTLSAFAGTLLKSIGEATLNAWTKVFMLPASIGGSENFAIAYLIVVICCFVGMILYLDRLLDSRPGGTDSTPKKVIWQWVGFGLLSLLTTGLPFYAAELPVNTVFPNDRFTLAFMFSTSLLLAGLLELISNRARRITILGLLIALAIGLQMHNSYLFRNDWKRQHDFFWQLVWRAPQLKPGTALLSDDHAFSFTDDDALTFALNWTYASNEHSVELPQAIFYITERLGGSLPGLEAGLPIEKEYYAATFSGSTDQVLVFHYAPPSCLRILDSRYDQNIVQLPFEKETGNFIEVRFISPLSLEALPLSDLDLVVPKPVKAASPPEFLFGAEPDPNWCTYFEKADLARQLGDWEQVAELYDDARSRGLQPQDISEYLPFIEAYARLGRMEDAWALNDHANDEGPVLNIALCELWYRVENLPISFSEYDRSIIEYVKQDNSCYPVP